VWSIACLRDVIVEGEDWACEIERRVHGVGEVVEEGEIVRFGGDGDAVTLGEVRGVELFLLDVISETVGEGGETYFKRTAGSRVETPIIVKIEAD
jgi:hypothetical protein